MLRCMSKNKHHNDMYSKEVGLCAKQILNRIGFNFQHSTSYGKGDQCGLFMDQYPFGNS